MRKKAIRWNKHKIIQLMLAITVAVLFGALLGRGMVQVGKTATFKEHRATLVAFIKGQPHPKHKRMISGQRLSSN
ncbi:MAG: hypothetical protein M3Q07_03875 [Pseudobdellovibrionaceae bacterium]|nr:hypothetical protein [Pseudobdellovibrionaceae bacterium]